MAVQLFTSVGIGAFRYTASIVPWTWEELEDLRKIWIQAYKLAWHLPENTASMIFTLPAHQGGLGLLEPLTILTQELSRHLQRCLQQDDVARSFTLWELEKAKKTWLCNSLEDLHT